jgi:tRNA nucleotidyltransferase (CCA-adding enzyme)
MKIKIYEVGGSLRDEFLGLTSKDKDYAVEASSFDEMRELIVSRGAKIYVETPKYLTIRAHDPILGPQDFTLCRKDGEYIDGRHPETVSPGTILEDLARRDFTMNAIARNVETGEILDPCYGRIDTKAHLICSVGNPYERLREDKLRAFRALRFSVCKGMTICADLGGAIECLKSKDFCTIPSERIYNELVKMFEFDPWNSFHLLDRTYMNLGQLVRERNIGFKPVIKNV